MRKTKTIKVLPTQNEAWGFWGTIRQQNEGGQARAWDDAFRVVVASGLKPADAREFLDSRAGRHFADQWIDSRDAAVVQVTKFTQWWKSLKRYAERQANPS